MSLNPVYLWQPNRTAAKASADIVRFSDGLLYGCRMKRFQHKR